MKKLLALLALAVMPLILNVGVANAATRATVTHYTAAYDCECFGHFSITGVHVTNTEFPGTDNGNHTAVGGRDNFTGTVTQPPSSELVLDYANAGEWCSDYDGQCTTTWSVTFEPDGTLSGWADYPNS